MRQSNRLAGNNKRAAAEEEARPPPPTKARKPNAHGGAATFHKNHKLLDGERMEDGRPS